MRIALRKPLSVLLLFVSVMAFNVCMFLGQSLNISSAKIFHMQTAGHNYEYQIQYQEYKTADIFSDAMMYIDSTATITINNYELKHTVSGLYDINALYELKNRNSELLTTPNAGYVYINPELSEIYGELAPVAYIRMLRIGCDAYRDGYYEENFAAVSKLDAYKITREDFLEKLKLDCDAMGAGRNLGELKSYVLLQFLNMKFGEQIYVFCSDDKNARNGMVAIGGANCISVLSSFIRLRKEIGLSREEAEPYIRSYLSYCLGKGQTTFRIQENSKERRMRKVPCEQVFDELFAGRMDEMKTGNLKYR